MSRISEFFGLYCGDGSRDFYAAMQSQICPYSGKICAKMRKSDPNIKIGTCSVKYQGQNVIICPHRMLEHNQIFIDCLHLLTLHEPGNELFLVPEVKLPGGSVDYFLVSAKCGKVRDFIGIELQTMDTTGTVWPERQKFLYEHGIAVERSDWNGRRSFGMNWKMTLKTILIQMHHKSETFEYLNKHLVLIMQNPLFEHMKRDFSFEDIHGVRIGDPVQIHSYDFRETDGRLCLSLDTRVSTDSSGIAKCLGLNAERKVELQEMIRILEQKLTEDRRFSVLLPSK